MADSRCERPSLQNLDETSDRFPQPEPTLLPRAPLIHVRVPCRLDPILVGLPRQPLAARLIPFKEVGPKPPSRSSILPTFLTSVRQYCRELHHVGFAWRRPLPAPATPFMSASMPSADTRRSSSSWWPSAAASRPAFLPATSAPSCLRGVGVPFPVHSGGLGLPHMGQHGPFPSWRFGTQPPRRDPGWRQMRPATSVPRTEPVLPFQSAAPPGGRPGRRGMASAGARTTGRSAPMAGIKAGSTKFPVGESVSSPLLGQARRGGFPVRSPC